MLADQLQLRVAFACLTSCLGWFPCDWQWMNLVLLVIARAAFGLSVAYFAYQTAVGQ